MQSLLTKNCKLFCLYIYLFLRLKPVECIECQKNKQEDKLFRIVLKVVFITIEANLTYPNLLQTSNLISWLFVFCSFFTIFDFSFVSFYIYKSSVNSFMWIYAFKRKKLWGNVCLQPRRYISISLHFFPPTGKFPFMQCILLETKMLPLISQNNNDACLFGQRVYNYFDYQYFWSFASDFHFSQLVKVLEMYVKN